MRRRYFQLFLTLLTTLSLLLLLITLIVWPITYNRQWVQTTPHSMSKGWPRTDKFVYFYLQHGMFQIDYFDYLWGSPTDPPVYDGDRRSLFGIKYSQLCRFTPTVHSTETDIDIPLWLVALLAAVLPAIHIPYIIRRARRTRQQRLAGLCPKCRYDLRAHAPGQKCPECGTFIEAPSSGDVPSLSEDQLH